MIVALKEPFAALSGVITGVNPENLNERYYFYYKKRTGKVFLKKCPKHTKPPTPAQLEVREKFKKYIHDKWADVKKETAL